MRWVLLLAALLLAGCAAVAPCSAVPLLRLTPAALGRSVAWQQQISVTANEQTRQAETYLEVDEHTARLALLSGAQVAARLVWDGERLQTSQPVALPHGFNAERILSDLQLMLWPAPAIRAALPAGWTLDDDGVLRTLRLHGMAWVQVDHPGALNSELRQLRDGYRLRVESRSMEDPS